MTPRILYIQYTNPAGYPPLEHSSRILADSGWQVLFLGTGALGTDKLRFPPHPNICVKQIPYCSAGWRQKVNYLLFCLWVLGWTFRWRAAWVYASDLLSCPVASLLFFVPGLKIIYHEHDTNMSEATGVFGRFCFRSRQWLARRAKLCVLPNHRRIDHFQRQTGADRNVVCVWNCPAEKEAFVTESGRGTRWDSSLTLFYHGSIVPSQLPASVLHALVLLPPQVRLRVAGYETIGHRGYVQNLKNLAHKLGIDDRVVFLGTVPSRQELLDLCRQCDIGLALFTRQTMQPMTGASNKPFDYMACGLSLLVPDSPDWRQMFVEPGYALACAPEEPESIAAKLRWFLDHPEQLQAMGEAGRLRIAAKWNYEAQFAPVKNFLTTGKFCAEGVASVENSCGSATWNATNP